ILPNPASRVWRGRCGPLSRSIRGRPAKYHPPRVSSEADLSSAEFLAMPVYTVHAPTAHAADFRATSKFAFVRDGFHFWAMVLGPLWLVWKRLWLALLGWLVLVVGLEVALASFGGGRLAVPVGIVLAVLMGLEASTLQRWTYSRRKWRQLDVVVADDEETAERRFFDRFTTGN